MQQTVHCHGNVLQCDREREIAVLYSAQHRIVTAADTHTGQVEQLMRAARQKWTMQTLSQNPEKANSLCRGCIRRWKTAARLISGSATCPTPPYHQAGQGHQQGCWVVEGHEGCHTIRHQDTQGASLCTPIAMRQCCMAC